MALAEEFEEQGNVLFKYRGVLPFLIIAAGLAFFVHTVNHIDPDRRSIFETSYPIFCILIILIGMVIRIIAVGYSAANTSGRNTEGQLADDLNTTGIYSMLRHPLYLGNYFMWLGFAMLPQNIWFVLLFTMIYQLYYERIMFAEEQFLRGKYGEQYLAWASRIPAFIPRLRRISKPHLSFSFKKVIRQEKNSFLYTFGLMLVFQALESFIRYGQVPLQSNYWLYAFIVSLLLYLIIKLVISQTSWLDERDIRH